MSVGGRGNIDLGNRWRDLDQIWHEGTIHIQEGYRLCGYAVGAAGGRGMGVCGRGNIDPAGIWTKFDMEVPHISWKVTGYVAMWWAWQVGVAWG